MRAASSKKRSGKGGRPSKKVEKKTTLTSKDKIRKQISELETKLARLRKSLGKAEKSDIIESGSIFQPDFFRELCAFSPVGIFVADAAGNGTFSNKRWQDIAGISFEEGLDMGWVKAVHPEDKKRVYSTWKKAAKEKRSFKSDFRVLRTDGSIRHVRTISQPMLTDTGKVAGYVGTVEDTTEEMQLESNLMAERVLNARILQHLPAAVLVTRISDGKVLFGNDYVEPLLGITPEGFKGKLPADFYADLNDRKALIAEMLKNGSVENFELRLKRTSGEFFWATSHVRKILYNGIDCLLTIFSDITGRKNLEVELQRRERQLARIFETTPSPIFLLDIDEKKDFRFAAVNSAFLRTTGLSSDRVIGHYAHEVIPESSWKMVSEKYRETLETGKLVRWEETSEFPAGKKTGIVKIAPITDTTGKTTQLVGSVHDISERVIAEEKSLRKAQLLDAVEQAIIATDLAGVITYWSRGAENLYGWSRDDTVGKNVAEILQPQAAHHLTIKFRENLTAGKPTIGEMVVRHRSGRDIHIQVAGSAIVDDKGQIIGRIGISQDITERIRREDALTAATAALKEAQSFAQLGRWELDLLTNRLDWSETIFEIFEIDKNKFGASYDAFLDAIHPDDREKVNEAYITSLETKQPYEIEHRLLMKDGRIKWVVEACRTDYNEAGQSIRSVGIIQDITRRKNMYDELKASHARVRDLESALNEHSIIAITDGKGTITFANDQFCRISGYDRDELLGQDHRILNSGYHSKAFFKDMWQTIQTGKVWKGEIKNRAQNGSFYWVDTTIVPFFGTGQKPYQYVAIRVDVTARKNAELALRRSEAHFRSVTQDLPAYISVYLSNGTLTYVNEAVAALVGKKPQDLIGANYLDFLNPEEKKKAQVRIKEFTTERPVITHEQYMVLPDGSERWQVWTNRAYFNEDGRPISYQGFGQDITAQKIAERELRRAQRRVTTTLNTMIDGMVEVNIEGEIIYANRGAERILNISMNEITGKYFQSREWKQIDAAGNPLLPENLPLAVAMREQREIGPIEHPLVGDDGKWKWISVYAAPLLSSIGELYGAVATFRDTTEQRQHEIVAREAASLQLLFDQAAVGVVLVDTHSGKFLRVNRRLAEMLGYSVDELLGIDFLKVTHPEDMNAHVTQMEALKAGEIENFVVEKRYIAKNGATIWASLSIARTWKSGEAPTRHITVIQDITEQKIAREQQDELRRKFQTELIQMQESDRAEFSRELHDSVGKT